MLSNSEILSQTNFVLILPDEINGKVQLNISAIPNENMEKFGYEYLSVFVKNERDAYPSNAIQGRYTVENDYLVFIPYFPFEKGLTYVARTKESDSSYRYQSFQVGEKDTYDKAELVGIYPSSDVLPENILRFYIYFNTPMKRDQALQHIHLVDAQGNVDHEAFMEFKQELWSADGKRLTLLFDPGRIKRGVSTNRELGPALLEGNKYSLTISENWQDVYGQKLQEEIKKEFVVIEAYRKQIEVSDWVICKPQLSSINALSICFDRIMDHALVQSMLQLEDEGGNRIAGRWESLQQEKQIQFIPDKIWKKGIYQIVVDSRLEDVAGNNLDNLLDGNLNNGNNNINNPQLTVSFELE